MIEPHPDFADSMLPRAADLGAFRLSPLGPAQTDEDYRAVTGSIAVLKGAFGDDWPEGLTRKENRVDMGWHEREFTTRRSFAWIIRDPRGAYLGCAYLYPDLGTRGYGKVVTWMCDTPDRPGRLAAFNATFADWLAPFLPTGYKSVWISNDQP